MVWVPPDEPKYLFHSKQSVQRRNENDFLFRAKKTSEWIGPSVDFDEYMAPTQEIDSRARVSWHFLALPAVGVSYGSGSDVIFVPR